MREDEPKPRDARGLTRKYPLEDFMSALEEMDGMATTTEISEIVGCSGRTARRSLDELRADDDVPVSQKEVGRYSLWLLSAE